MWNTHEITSGDMYPSLIRRPCPSLFIYNITWNIDEVCGNITNGRNGGIVDEHRREQPGQHEISPAHNFKF